MSAQSPLAVVILAAGKGTRMKSDMPKAMHEIAGLPVINWLLQTVEKLDPDKVVVVVGPDMPDLQLACSPHTTVVQDVRDGTGGAVRCALPELEGFAGDVLILLGDAPLVKTDTMSALVDARGRHGLSVLAVRMPDPSGYGRVVVTADGTLERIVEDKDATPEEQAIDLINTGAFCVDGTRLAEWVGKITDANAQHELYITDLPEIAAEDGIETKVFITDDPAEAQGCNTPADLALLEATLQDRLRMKAMAEGAVLRDPPTVYFSFDTILGAGCIVEPHVIFGPGVTAQGGVTIKGFSHIEGAHIESGATVGPFARLRPGADIGTGARIGNFVEIKKSSIGAGSKIGHLAYVGDCKMGENVNFSAGAITVNYDGYNKYKTVIGDGAMIGSDVSLVAPVDIGAGAFVAAGSTITTSVPEDALAIAREKPEIKEGWASQNRKKTKP